MSVEAWKIVRASRIGGKTAAILGDLKEQAVRMNFGERWDWRLGGRAGAQKVFAIPGNGYAPGAGGVSRQRRKRMRW